MHLNRQTKINP